MRFKRVLQLEKYIFIQIIYVYRSSYVIDKMRQNDFKLREIGTRVIAIKFNGGH